jgi:hypothetical protein
MSAHVDVFRVMCAKWNAKCRMVTASRSTWTRVCCVHHRLASRQRNIVRECIISVHGAWCMVHGAWCMARDTFACTRVIFRIFIIYRVWKFQKVAKEQLSTWHFLWSVYHSPNRTDVSAQGTISKSLAIHLLVQEWYFVFLLFIEFESFKKLQKINYQLGILLLTLLGFPKKNKYISFGLVMLLLLLLLLLLQLLVLVLVLVLLTGRSSALTDWLTLNDWLYVIH